jgi:hypothetical protein
MNPGNAAPQSPLSSPTSLNTQPSHILTLRPSLSELLSKARVLQAETPRLRLHHPLVGHGREDLPDHPLSLYIYIT